MGNGRLRYFTPAEVLQVAQALSELNFEEMLQRFRPEEFERANVYPGGWRQPDTRGWLLDSLRGLRAYYVAAAEGQCAMLLGIL